MELTIFSTTALQNATLLPTQASALTLGFIAEEPMKATHKMDFLLGALP